MSFICGNCKVSQPPRTQSIPIILGTRKVEYSRMTRETDEEESVLKVSKGSEIVKEIRVCPDCADEFPKEMRG